MQMKIEEEHEKDGQYRGSSVILSLLVSQWPLFEDSIYLNFLALV